MSEKILLPVHHITKASTCQNYFFLRNKNNKQKKANILIFQISEPSSEGTVLSALFFTSNGHFVNGADVCDVGFKNNLAIPTILVCYFVHIRSSVCPDMNDRKLKQGKQTFLFSNFLLELVSSKLGLLASLLAFTRNAFWRARQRVGMVWLGPG